uniref:Uncharacterized protein n=1 Tax=Anguilla anguilla TaxID=7936 RepID=A0A0E9SK10_ANGAN
MRSAARKTIKASCMGLVTTPFIAREQSSASFRHLALLKVGLWTYQLGDQLTYSSPPCWLDMPGGQGEAGHHSWTVPQRLHVVSLGQVTLKQNP